MTAAQQRARAKVEYDAYLDACPSRVVLDRLTDKWVALVVSALAADGALRYSGLARRIAGVSPKMLTQTLRNLERDGLLTRSVEATVPVTVTYELTPLGVSLARLLRRLKDWAEMHVPEVEAARSAYDAAGS